MIIELYTECFREDTLRVHVFCSDFFPSRLTEIALFCYAESLVFTHWHLTLGKSLSVFGKDARRAQRKDADAFKILKASIGHTHCFEMMVGEF